jgi:hypothetical protein
MQVRMNETLEMYVGSRVKNLLNNKHYKIGLVRATTFVVFVKKFMGTLL